MVNPLFWRDKSVLVTGHTGFKGGWLSIWLAHMGARVHGYALPPATVPNLYELSSAGAACASSHLEDIRDRQTLRRVVKEIQPEVVFHLAAQALVRESYANPVDTYETNVMGTVNLLDAVRHSESVRSIIVVTSDKCYDNKEWPWGYRENEPLGGDDPYSASKACTEIVTQSWNKSYFADQGKSGTPCVATARAGNVIGGGDWSTDRIIPDILASLDADRPVALRNPNAVRPWQHVLDPLTGYLCLAQRLYDEGARWASAWNFGPLAADELPVSDLVDLLIREMGSDNAWQQDESAQPSEAQILRLDCSKAHQQLRWRPTWPLRKAVREVAHWHKAWLASMDMHKISTDTIDRFVRDTQKWATPIG